MAQALEVYELDTVYIDFGIRIADNLCEKCLRSIRQNSFCKKRDIVIYFNLYYDHNKSYKE